MGVAEGARRAADAKIVRRSGTEVAAEGYRYPCPCVIFTARPTNRAGRRRKEANLSDIAKRIVVLVVEDDPFLRMTAIELVAEAGFEAVPAANADQAVRILEARADVRIVFTDVDMPGSMDGRKLAAAIGGRWPSIEVILTSGQVAITADELPARRVFFSKPYDHRQVIATLHRMAA